MNSEDLRETLEDYDHLTDNISGSNYQNYPHHVARLNAFLKEKEVFSALHARLRNPEDFSRWYEDAKTTRKGMVGSGQLEWPVDDQKRLGLWLSLLEAIGAGKESVDDFCVNFMYAGTNYNDMAREFSYQIISPFARDFRRMAVKEARRMTASTGSSEDIVPASDRYVRISHNSAEFQRTDEALAKLIDAVRSSNEYAASDPEDHEQRIVELESGKGLLRATRVNIAAVRILLVRGVKHLAQKFADHAIGVLAAAAFAALSALLGGLI